MSEMLISESWGDRDETGSVTSFIMLTALVIGASSLFMSELLISEMLGGRETDLDRRWVFVSLFIAPVVNARSAKKKCQRIF
jgi:hypothetical protein